MRDALEKAPLRNQKSFIGFTRYLMNKNNIAYMFSLMIKSGERRDGNSQPERNQEDSDTNGLFIKEDHKFSQKVLGVLNDCSSFRRLSLAYFIIGKR